jgi:DNA-binding CsgD family transcriptional regulator
VWGTLWQFLPNFLPDAFEQTLERVPRQGRGATAARAGSTDYEEFRGWRWVCPGCRKQVRTIFCPIPPVNFPEMLGHEPVRDQTDADARPHMPPCFACMDCHNVLYLSRANPQYWNFFVGYISAGLLYGREVPRPAWFTPQRKRAYRPLPGRAPSRRMEEVRERLLKGWDLARIARDLQISYSRVGAYAHQIYKHHRVRSRGAFLRMFGVPVPEELTRGERVLELLCAGRSNGAIARALGISKTSIRNRVKRLCHTHRVSGREELVMKHCHWLRYARQREGTLARKTIARAVAPDVMERRAAHDQPACSAASGAWGPQVCPPPTRAGGMSGRGQPTPGSAQPRHASESSQSPAENGGAGICDPLLT